MKVNVICEQDWNLILVSLLSWPGQLLSLFPCERLKVLARMVFLGIFVDFTDSFVEFTHCFVDYGRVRHLRASSKIFTNLRSFGAFGEVTIFFVEFTHFFVDFWCYKRLRASSKIFKILASILFPHLV